MAATNTSNSPSPPFPFSPATSTAGNEPNWDYDLAFSRHRGLINKQEQQILKKSRIGIIGMGGVGGSHLVTLLRLGVGAFHIADPDTFEVANFNRQYGAKVINLGKSKAEAMAHEALTINPDVELKVFTEAINPSNIREFLDQVDVVVDGVDFFAIETRRLVFREARNRGIWAVTAGPLGFSTGWLVFSPTGMSFDDYFAFHDGMDTVDKVAAFAVGLTPRATHLRYLDLNEVDLGSGKGPSAGLACQLCSGVASVEIMKILLERTPLYPAPWYFQFDAYRYLFSKRKLLFGNRHPLQRIKRWYLARKLRQLLPDHLVNKDTQPTASPVPSFSLSTRHSA